MSSITLPGPVITRFELNLAPGVKAARISNLSRDLALFTFDWRCVSLKLFPRQTLCRSGVTE
ncbi:hypothetical protein HT118_28900 [Escherichia coli]|nr:hypothetical protein [Escherichia coli]